METRRIGFKPDALLEPHEALARYFAAVQLLAPRVEHVALEDALHRVLARPIEADIDYPAKPRSAMDGFAARTADLPGRLRIAGTIGIATPWDGPLQHGDALRIPTGGVVPDGADVVVPIEDAAVTGEFVELPSAPAGDAITPAGSDMLEGETMLREGSRLRTAEIALLATLGFASVPVYRRPAVAVISSGDELVPVSATPRPGQIRDSNRYGVAALLEQMGAQPAHLRTARDEAGALEDLLREALQSCDGVVLTGGSSVGEHDLTPEIVSRLGSPGVVVHGLRVKPGKPTVLGAIDGKPIVGLPGNPTSALTILDMVARPIFERLCGIGDEIVFERALLATPLSKRKGWTWYVPAQLRQAEDGLLAYPLELRSSSVSLLARAQGVLVLGEHIDKLPPGAAVTVRRL